MFNEHLYTSPFRTDRSTDNTSMLICEPLHYLPNIFPMEYLSNGLPVSVPNRPSYAPVCVPVCVPGVTDRSQPIRSSACSADPTDVELVSQQDANSNMKIPEQKVDLKISSCADDTMLFAKGHQ